MQYTLIIEISGNFHSESKKKSNAQFDGSLIVHQGDKSARLSDILLGSNDYLGRKDVKTHPSRSTRRRFQWKFSRWTFITYVVTPFRCQASLYSVVARTWKVWLEKFARWNRVFPSIFVQHPTHTI